jgi:3-oxoadipate CoA-transferase, beta subunit
MAIQTRIKGIPREMIAFRASQDIPEHSYVNLGIGIPTLISNWIKERDIMLHAEIGMLKTGPLAKGEAINQDRVNASGQPVIELPGSSFFDVVESFAMIRGGHIDVAVMGAFQVNARGDYAGWANPARGEIGNIGGSMDLCCGVKQLFIAMEHTTPDGELKLVHKLTYPPTALGKVSKIFTDLAVIEVTPQGLLLKEVAPGLTVRDVQSVTEPELIVSPYLKEMDL